MRVLVSNDDGVDAPGIRILAEGLRAAGHDVVVVAPDRDRSGASNSLTLDLPVRVSKIDDRTWRVHGTPADCVHVGVAGQGEGEPDSVVSGLTAPLIVTPAGGGGAAASEASVTAFSAVSFAAYAKSTPSMVSP